MSFLATFALRRPGWALEPATALREAFLGRFEAGFWARPAALAAFPAAPPPFFWPAALDALLAAVLAARGALARLRKWGGRYLKAEQAAALDAYRKSLAIRERLVAADPGNADTLYMRGKAKTGIGDLKGAEKCYEKALAVDALHERTHGRGESLGGDRGHQALNPGSTSLTNASIWASPAAGHPQTRYP